MAERDIFPQCQSPNENECISELIEEVKVADYESDASPPSQESAVDVVVEVEDTVVYVETDNDQIEKQALITLEKSNPDCGLINVNTPIARALLGAMLGSTVEATLPKGTVSLLIKDIIKPV